MGGCLYSIFLQIPYAPGIRRNPNICARYEYLALRFCVRP